MLEALSEARERERERERERKSNFEWSLRGTIVVGNVVGNMSLGTEFWPIIVESLS